MTRIFVCRKQTISPVFPYISLSPTFSKVWTLNLAVLPLLLKLSPNKINTLPRIFFSSENIKLSDRERFISLALLSGRSFSSQNFFWIIPIRLGIPCQPAGYPGEAFSESWGIARNTFVFFSTHLSVQVWYDGLQYDNFLETLWERWMKELWLSSMKGNKDELSYFAPINGLGAMTSAP